VGADKGNVGGADLQPDGHATLVHTHTAGHSNKCRKAWRQVRCGAIQADLLACPC
jgi:hypothetical protein